MSSRFGIRSTRVFLHNSHKPALVMVADGVVVDVLDRGARVDVPTIDIGSLLLMPALIDTSVSVADPGRTHWEGFATATAAAAAGGVAVLVDMPHASIPPRITASAVLHKHSATAGALRVDVGFWGGIVPGNLPEARLMADAGVFGFASSLGPTGFDRFPPIGVGDLEPALRTAHAMSRPLLVRPEIGASAPTGPDYAAYVRSHPPQAEIDGVAAVIEAVRRTGAWAHIVGLSSAEALPLLAAARRQGHLVTAETTPHHLVFTAEEIDTTLYAARPPIRDAANREGLWEGLADGVIDMIVSDHSPVGPASRTDSFATTEPGIASLELRLPVVWSEARRRGFRLSHLVQWLGRAPAALLRLPSGRIAPGQRADLIAWDPDAEFVLDATTLHQRHKETPYTGMTLRGVIHRTWSAGRLVFSNGELIGEPEGTILEQVSRAPTPTRRRY